MNYEKCGIWNTRLLIEALKFLPRDSSLALQHLILETHLLHLRERPEDFSSDFISHILMVCLDTMQVIEDKRFQEIIDLSLKELAKRISLRDGLALASINPTVAALNPFVFKHVTGKCLQINTTEASTEFALAILEKESGQKQVSIALTEFIQAHGLDISDRLANFEANKQSYGDQIQYRMMILQGTNADIEAKVTLVDKLWMRYLKFNIESPFAGEDANKDLVLARVSSV